MSRQPLVLFALWVLLSPAAFAQTSELLKLRKAAILESVDALELKPTAELREKQCHAAWLLGELRADDQNAIEALLHCITLVGEGGDDDLPLARFPAAAALVRIGNPLMIHLDKFLRHERTDRELKLVTFVVSEIDGVKVAHSRLSVRLDEINRLAPDGLNANKILLKNIQTILAWTQEDFLKKRANWP